MKVTLPQPPNVSPKAKRIAGALAAFALLLVLANPLVVVPAGHRGVMTTFGRVHEAVLSEGLHVRIPIAQQVHLMSVQLQKGERSGEAASRDLQHVNVTAAINYRIAPDEAARVFQSIGNLDAVGERVILPTVQEAVKAAVAGFTAEELVTRRAEVRTRIREQVDERLRARGVVVEDFAIVAFGFGKEFEAAIEEKSKAEQLKLKAERDLQRIRVEAEQKVTQAKADADALMLQRKAEAEALALQRSAVTPELLQWEAVRRWDGKLPQIVNGQGTLLQLPLPALTQKN